MRPSPSRRSACAHSHGRCCEQGRPARCRPIRWGSAPCQRTPPSCGSRHWCSDRRRRPSDTPPPSRISPNPDNPRSNLGDLTDLAGSLKSHGQKQAITVMNRDAYLKASPEREADLEPDTAYVVIDGSSRLAAAREAGLETVAVMVSDDQGNNAEELLQSALIANIMRNDLSEIDEARALQRLLNVYGSQRALAKQLHRSQGWVSQRLALLNLAPELQDRIGEEPIELLRAVGSKPAAEQEAALQELKEQRSSAESAKTSKKQPESTDRPSPAAEPAPAPAARFQVPTVVITT
ncbi:ParB/RepB/Spo0J family partition protein [Streptomyces kaempferi]